MTVTIAELNDHITLSEHIWKQERQKTESLLQELLRAQQETAMQMKETDRQMKETDRQMKDLIEGQKRATGYIGGLRKSIGDVVEHTLLPGIRLKMNNLGHCFSAASPGKRFFTTDGNVLAEIDLLLENGAEIMVVEVKTRFMESDIEKHVERMKLLRANETLIHVTDKVMYAAAAGIRFDAKARRTAVENGIYLIDVNENDDKIIITPPPAENVGAW